MSQILTPFSCMSQCSRVSSPVSTVGDGRLGYAEGAPYDAIHVGAAAATVPKAVRTCAAIYKKRNMGFVIYNMKKKLVKSLIVDYYLIIYCGY